MPDPQHDLAPIVELAASQPAQVATASHGQAYAGLGLLAACVLLVVAIVWYRRRSKPIRAIRRLAQSADPRRAADALAALLTAHAIEPDATWRDNLDRLRFGRPAPDDAASLAWLCRQAEAALKRRR